MTGTGFFPSGRDQAYHIEESRRGSGHDLFLTGTGEVGLMGFHENEILEESTLPRTYTTVSTCFRREAGAAGKDTAGLYRIHQFEKVEQVIVTRADPEASRHEHLAILANSELLLQSLELPYRVVTLASGDLGFSAAKTYDLEVWLPGQGRYREISSCSNFEDFQARRAGIRYRDENGKARFVHTLNGSGVALPRLVVALLENGQQADGSIVLPPALAPYMGGIERLLPPA